jgi:uncharacterized protein YwlG (UPF0340 family)
VSPYHQSGQTQNVPSWQLPGDQADALGAEAMTPRKAAGIAARVIAFNRMETPFVKNHIYANA